MRPKRHRWIQQDPTVTYFKPIGVPLMQSGIEYLEVDEFEALRLSDLEKASQNEAAKKMKISQSTFHRLLETAHEKVTRAIVEGRAIRVGGGSYISKQALENIKKSRSKGGKNMEKICISTNNTIVSPVFGRCPVYTIVTIENKKVTKKEEIQNPAMNLAGGAGIQAAQQVAQLGVSAVITGAVGPNAMPILKTAGVKIYSAANIPVDDAIQAYIDGKLTEVSAPGPMRIQPGTGLGLGRGMGRGAGMGRGMGGGRGRGRQL